MTLVIKQSSDISSMLKIMEELPRRGKFDAKRHCGVLKLKKTPLEIQKAMRDEWE